MIWVSKEWEREYGMFSHTKEYIVKNPYGYEEEMSPNELWQWFLYNQPDAFNWFSFVDKIKDDGELKLSNGVLIRYTGLRQTDSSSISCKHSNKYINVVSATLKFWVCPDCKKDLGDVK